MRQRMCVVVLLVLSAMAVAAAPAIPAKPELVKPVAELLVPEADLGDFPDLPALWSSLYFKGDWKSLQESVKKYLSTIRDPNLDFANNIYSVVIFTTERKEDGELIRFLVGNRVTEEFSNNFRGTDRFREIFVTSTIGSALQSFISVTPLPDPRQAQIEGLLKALPLPAIMAGLRSATTRSTFRSLQPTPNPPPVNPVRHAVALYETTISDQLSAVAIETFIALDEDNYIANRAQEGPALATKIREKQESLRFRIARSSICLRELNQRLADDGSAAATVIAEPLTGAHRKAIAKEIRKAYNNFVPSVSCTADDTAAMIVLEQEYLKLVGAETPETIVGEFTHDNVPLRRWNVAMGGGVIVHSVSDDRGKVEDGKLMRKELQGEGLVTLNVLWHPVAYDPASSKVTPAERTKLFIGVVTTPDIGLSAGVDISIFKEFGFEIGYAHMRVDEKTGTAKFGEPVPDNEEGTKKGMAGGFFVGFSYKF